MASFWTSLSLASTGTVRCTGATLTDGWLTLAKVGGSKWPSTSPGRTEGGSGSRLSPGLHVSPPAHEDLFSCCRRKNFRGAPYSFFAIHITAALVLFMTDGMMVSQTGTGGWPAKEGPRGFLENLSVVQLTQSFPREVLGVTVFRIAHSPAVPWASVPASCYRDC